MKTKQLDGMFEKVMESIKEHKEEVKETIEKMNGDIYGEIEILKE